jgi:hypothetical protein
MYKGIMVLKDNFFFFKYLYRLIKNLSMKNTMKTVSGLASAILISLLIACGGNGGAKKNRNHADSAGIADVVPPPANSGDSSATPAIAAPTADCMIRANLGARVWKASGITVNRVNEHLTISHDGDYTDTTDIHNLQIIINNYNGPGTYTFDGGGNVSFSFGFTQTDNYLTAAQGSSGSITITEHTKTSLKATFSFKAGSTEGDVKFIEVTNGEISAKDGGNCRVQEYVNP